MGIQTLPAASAGVPSDNWVTVSTVTPTNGTSTVSFTSLSGYKKYMLKIVSPTLSGTGVVYTTINSDSGSNYSWASPGQTTSAVQRPIFAIDATNFNVNSGGVTSATLNQVLIIQSADTTGAKLVNGWVRYNDGTNLINNPVISGAYFGSAVISSIQVVTSGITYAGGGTITLYGAA